MDNYAAVLQDTFVAGFAMLVDFSFLDVLIQAPVNDNFVYRSGLATPGEPSLVEMSLSAYLKRDPDSKLECRSRYPE